MSAPQPGYQVFVSHSSTDTWVAKQLSDHLRKCGVATFLDVNDIEHGDDFEEAIVKAAEQSNELMVLLTPWAKDRNYIWMEIGIFRGARKRVVGVLHGLKPADIATDPQVPVLKKIDLVDLNDVDRYFSQVAKRAAGGQHGRA